MKPRYKNISGHTFNGGHRRASLLAFVGDELDRIGRPAWELLRPDQRETLGQAQFAMVGRKRLK